MTKESPPTAAGWLSWLTAIKGLTVTNVLVIAGLVAVATPAWLVYSMTQNTELLDRFFSNYRELSTQNVPCNIREAKFRGGGTIWSISTGFAFAGRDRYVVAVVLDHHPNDEDALAYCETVKLIADDLHDDDTVKETLGQP